MKAKIIRITVGVITSFIALTSIGGGIAMLSGVDEFPREWLANSPFTNYTIPALLLTIIVGGTSLIASFLLFKNHKPARKWAIVAGLSLSIYVAVEVVMLAQEPPGPTGIEIFYFILAVMVIAGSVIEPKYN